MEELFKNEYSLFLKEKENFYKGYSITMVNGSTFEAFLKSKLKNKSKEFKNSCNLKNIQINKSIEDTVDSIIKINKFNISGSNLNIILKYLTFGEKSLYNFKDLSNLNSLNFNNCLTFKIKEGKNLLENKTENEINLNIFNKLDKNFDKNEIQNYNIDSNNDKQKDWGQIKSDFQKNIDQ